MPNHIVSVTRITICIFMGEPATVHFPSMPTPSGDSRSHECALFISATCQSQGGGNFPNFQDLLDLFDIKAVGGGCGRV